MRPSPPNVPEYELLEPIWAGGWFTVYGARRTADRRPAAVKVAHGDRSIARLRREAAILSPLNHPSIVELLDSGDDWLAMELLTRSAADHAHDGPLEPRRAADIVGRAAAATAWLHRRGIIHADIKPANILLADDGRAKLADFGLAIVRDDSGFDDDESGFVGTPIFAAPEMLTEPRSRLNAAAIDVYALGATLYRLLTGRAPFEPADGRSVFESLGSGEPRPPSKHRPELSARFDALCLRCLRRDPNERPRACELTEELVRSADEGRIVLHDTR